MANEIPLFSHFFHQIHIFEECKEQSQLLRGGEGLLNGEGGHCPLIKNGCK